MTFISHHIGITIPTDEVICFRGVGLNHQCQVLSGSVRSLPVDQCQDLLVEVDEARKATGAVDVVEL